MKLKAVVSILEKRGTTKMWLWRKFNDKYPIPRMTFWLYLKKNKLTKQQKSTLKKLLK